MEHLRSQAWRYSLSLACWASPMLLVLKQVARHWYSMFGSLWTLTAWYAVYDSWRSVMMGLLISVGQQMTDHAFL